MTHLRRSLGIWALLAAGGGAAACGSKSGLLLGADVDAGGTPTGTGGSAAGGSAAGGASAGAAGAGGVSDAGPDAPPPLPDCVYVQHGEPIVLFTYAEGVHTPTLARLSAGSPGTPARLAFGLTHEHFWHPELRVAEVTITPDWPDGVSVTHPMVLYGIDAHAPGHIVPQSGGGAGLALLYFHADEASPNVVPGVKFRRFDTSAWKPFDEVFVEQLGGYAYSIAAGPGNGYGVTWRSATSGDAGNAVVSPRAAVLDGSGSIVAGPIDIAAASAYPGIGASMTHGGQGYLVAHNSRGCAGAGDECTNRLTLGRLEPGQLVETGSVAPVPGRRARTPLIRSYASATWVAWREQPIEAKPGQDVPSTMRLGEVDATGKLGTSVWQTEAHPDAGAELWPSDQGVVLIWGERAAPNLQPHEVGHSRLRLRQLSKMGQELQELELPTTSLTSGTAYSVTTLAEPRALIVAWTSQAPTPASHARAHVARFDCVPQ